MKLATRNHQYWLWYWSIFRELLRRKLSATLTVVVLSVSSIITGFLAFMLPLKVIILAGSDRVPRYFAFFITEEAKMDWIIGLTIGAIVCFLLTLLFDAITKRVSEKAGSNILEEANQLSLESDQDKVVGGFYSKICSVQAGLIFGGLSMALLLVLHPTIFMLVTGLVLVEWVFSLWAVRGDNDLSPVGLKRYILVRYKDYVSLLSNINFLIGFLVILIPYLMGDDRNIIVSLISFLLLRRMLTVLSSMVKTSVELEKNRLKINALLFRHHQVVQKQRSATLALLDFLSKSNRTSLVGKVVQENSEQPGVGKESSQQRTQVVTRNHSAAGSALSDFEVQWQDPTIRSIRTLLAFPAQTSTTAENVSTETQSVVYQAQIFPPKKAHLLDNEEFLFNFFDREALFAPKVVNRFQQGKFHGQVIQYGTGQLHPEPWGSLQARLIQHLWCQEPREELKQAYCSTHRLLADKLDTVLMSRVEVGVDTPEETAVLAEFTANLPEIAHVLGRIPLYVHNPDLIEKNVIANHDGEPLIVSWASWTLEPIGYEWPKSFRNARPENLIEMLSNQRADVPADLEVWELELPGLCRELIRRINRYEFKKALAVMARINYLFVSHTLSSAEAEDDDRENYSDEDEDETDEAFG